MKRNLDDELLSAYLDGELTPAERSVVERRLQEDPAARKLLEQFRAAGDSLRGLPTARVGTDLTDDVLAAAEREMLLEPAPVTGAGTRAANLVRQVARRFLQPRALLWSGVMIAVAGFLAWQEHNRPQVGRELARHEAVLRSGESARTAPSIHAASEPAERKKEELEFRAAPPPTTPPAGATSRGPALAEAPAAAGGQAASLRQQSDVDRGGGIGGRVGAGAMTTGPKATKGAKPAKEPDGMSPPKPAAPAPTSALAAAQPTRTAPAPAVAAPAAAPPPTAAPPAKPSPMIAKDDAPKAEAMGALAAKEEEQTPPTVGPMQRLQRAIPPVELSQQRGRLTTAEADRSGRPADGSAAETGEPADRQIEWTVTDASLVAQQLRTLAAAQGIKLAEHSDRSAKRVYLEGTPKDLTRLLARWDAQRQTLHGEPSQGQIKEEGGTPPHSRTDRQLAEHGYGSGSKGAAGRRVTPESVAEKAAANLALADKRQQQAFAMQSERLRKATAAAAGYQRWVIVLRPQEPRAAAKAAATAPADKP